MVNLILNLNIKPPFPTDGYGYEYNQRQDDDNYFEQPGKLFRLQSEDAKEEFSQIQQMQWKA